MANVMVVEDNESYRELLKDLCELDNHSVIESSSAEDVISMLKDTGDDASGSRKIDLVICDYYMGDMNGYELIFELRQHDALRRVPILMISSTDKDLGDLLKVQGIAFLPKPTPNGAVVARIRELLAHA